MPSTSASTRVMRSHTTSTPGLSPPSILGKRSQRSVSCSSSVASIKSSASILTPDPTPNPKRARFASGEIDDRSNKENIPPLRDVIEESPIPPRAARLTRRASGEYVPSPSSSTPRSLSSPQTPSSKLDSLVISTPPPTPPTPATLHARARALLRSTSNSTHVLSLCGRERERAVIAAFFRDMASQNVETVLYISGSPGTGKTALVNSVLASTLVEEDVKVIFLNCMAFSNIDALWERLAEEFSDPIMTSGRKGKGKKLCEKDIVLKSLQEHHMKCILILDELDHLASSSASLQPLFTLSTNPGVAFRIIGIANTHTLMSSNTLAALLPQASTSQMAPKVKTIHFAPYTPSELHSILQKRLSSLPQEDLSKLLPMPALTLLTKKVAALTGDVRVLFEVLRNAIDLALPPSMSPVQPDYSVTLNPGHILSALKSYTPSSTTSTGTSLSPSKSGSGSATNSETATKVRNLGLQARLVLLALLLASKRLSSGLSLSSPPSTPQSKRSPVKRSLSSTNTVQKSKSESVVLNQGIDATQMHAYYVALLNTADAFSPVSRPEFSDLLGVLETTGLITMSTARASGGAIKRSTSFAGKMKAAAGGGMSATQEVALVSDVRQSEVVRGLGIPTNADGSQGEAGLSIDVREEEVRTTWEREMGKIRREMKAQAQMSGTDHLGKTVVGFDEAIED